jgi:hypothetical protein
VTEAQQPVAFARLIAKIALGYAEAAGALRQLATRSPVAASVLDRADEIGRWVGTSAPTASGPPGALHAVALRQDPEAGLLVADVQLFSDSRTPLYHVVLGELRESSAD